MLTTLNIKDIKGKVGDLIKALRKRDNLSQEQLAIKLNLSRYTITNLESGQNATVDTLFKVFQYFGVLENLASLIESEISKTEYKSLY